MDVLKKYIGDGRLKITEPDNGNSWNEIAGKGWDSSEAKSVIDDLFGRCAIKDWNVEVAKSRMKNLLDRMELNINEKNMTAVLAPNDKTTLGIIEVLEKKQPKYKNKPAYLPRIAGQDAIFESAISIAENRQYMTVFKDTNRLAEAAIIVADAIITSAESVLVSRLGLKFTIPAR